LALRSDKGLQDLIDNAEKKIADLQAKAAKLGTFDIANAGAIKDSLNQQLEILGAAQEELRNRNIAGIKAEQEANLANLNAALIESSQKAADAFAIQYAKAIADASAKARQLVRDQQLADDRQAFVKSKVESGMTDIDRLREINFELENRPGKKAKEVDKDAPVELEDVTKEIDKSLASAANSMFAIYDLMSGLGKEESGPQKFLKILSGILGIVGSIPGIGSGFGIAGSILGGIGARLNTGGWVGGIGGNNDSVHALLTPKEYVVNRNAAATAPKLLEAINAGYINDKLLTKIADKNPIVIVEQDKVVKAIQSMPQVDYYKQGSILFETRISADRMRQQRKARITI
jgi:hypothetical protein